MRRSDGDSGRNPCDAAAAEESAAAAALLRRVRIVLVRPRGAANVGAAARAMKNMGLRELVLVRPAHAPPSGGDHGGSRPRRGGGARRRWIRSRRRWRTAAWSSVPPVATASIGRRRRARSAGAASARARRRRAGGAGLRAGGPRPQQRGSAGMPAPGQHRAERRVSVAEPGPGRVAVSATSCAARRDGPRSAADPAPALGGRT